MGRDPVMLRKTQPLCFPLGQPPAALPVQNPAPNPTTMKLPRILTTLLPALGASVQLVAQSTPAPQPTQEERVRGADGISGLKLALLIR